MYMLDTNICIYAIKNKPESVLKEIKKKINKGLVISVITLAELEYGVKNSLYPQKNQIALIEFLSIFEIVPFDSEAARAFGEIKSSLKEKGLLIGPMDTLIAAQAVSGNYTLVTNNTKEFSRIPNLKYENWCDK